MGLFILLTKTNFSQSPEEGFLLCLKGGFCMILGVGAGIVFNSQIPVVATKWVLSEDDVDDGIRTPSITFN